ncbi:MAG: 50S ribosomal protein L15 [bacterium]|nr:50S ribosomal protein L15 [bacterium]
MQLHDIKRKTKNKKRPLIGRGGKRGKTSGKGTKGQKSRSGRKMRPELRDFIKRMPKLRGYAFKSFADRAVALPLSALEKNFKSGDRVDPKTLVSSGIIQKQENKFPRVKILGSVRSTEITKKLTVSGIEVSASAKAAIEKAGGKVHE